VITVIRNPIGSKLSDNPLEGEATDSAGDVIITTSVAHGLSDGDYIYVESNVGTYNGFRYVDSVSYNTFKLKESKNGDYIPYKRDASIEYQVSVLQHGVQCVHLPIVYELESSVYPNNTEEESYTPNTVATFADNNGRVQLNLSSALSDPTRYSKIELVGTGPLAGVYQIIQVLQPWSVVIDLNYSGSYSFAGYTVVKYYDNYSINVNLYSGLLSGHPWENEKPVVLLATLRLVPDETNKALFSINEYLRSLIKTLNDLTIDTFPNNIHFLTEFYIGYFESYDVSDGDEITTLEGDETVDEFVGQAINAKNEFKNLYSGHLSEYVSEDGYPAQWLTDFENPIAIVGYFFDVSFYNHLNEVDIVITMFKRSVELVTEEVQTIQNPGRGIIRIELTPETGFDEYCIQASTPGGPGATSDLIIQDLSSWENIPGSGTDWIESANPNISIPVTAGSHASDKIAGTAVFTPVDTYSLTIEFTRTNPVGVTFVISSLDVSNTPIDSNIYVAGIGVAVADSISLTLVPVVGTEVKVSLNFSFTAAGPDTDVEVQITNVYGTQTAPDIEPQIITEQLCVHILEECDSTLIGELRETESGDYRLLE